MLLYHMSQSRIVVRDVKSLNHLQFVGYCFVNLLTYHDNHTRDVYVSLLVFMDMNWSPMQ